VQRVPVIRHAQNNQRGIVRERAKRDRAALLPLPPDPYLVVSRTQRVVGRDGYFSFEGRRYALPSGLQTPGGRVELVLGVHEMEARSLSSGKHLARYERGRPSRVADDPREETVVLAEVLGALPASLEAQEVHRRPLTFYEEVADMITERIKRNAHELKLFGLAEGADDLIERAQEASLGYREFLDLILEEEYGVVEGRRYASRLKLSGLPNHKTLEEFDRSFQPELDPKRLSELGSLRFLEKRLCALILGPSGVGKTHIAVGVGMEAIRRGYVVRYSTLDELVRDLRKADRLGKLREKLSYYQRSHLLILDEVGYLPLGTEDANHFFQLVNRRYAKGSMIVTSNKRDSEWASYSEKRHSPRRSSAACSTMLRS
jgi:DNA replication protein DnaC